MEAVGKLEFEGIFGSRFAESDVPPAITPASPRPVTSRFQAQASQESKARTFLNEQMTD